MLRDYLPVSTGCFPPPTRPDFFGGGKTFGGGKHSASGFRGQKIFFACGALRKKMHFWRNGKPAGKSRGGGKTFGGGKQLMCVSERGTIHLATVSGRRRKTVVSPSSATFSLSLAISGAAQSLAISALRSLPALQRLQSSSSSSLICVSPSSSEMRLPESQGSDGLRAKEAVA